MKIVDEGYIKRQGLKAQLEREIFPLQGVHTQARTNALQFNWGPINDHFPGKRFPVGGVHEFLQDGLANRASTGAFISAIVGALMQSGGICIWIHSSDIIFPHALEQYGIIPHQVIFLHLKEQKDILWATEQSLKCNGISAVVAEISNIDLTASRRLQLAVEQSGVTGFIIRPKSKGQPTASIARWRIRPLESYADQSLPGVGYACWNIELLKIRGGKPGEWQMAWKNKELLMVVDPGIMPATSTERKIV